MKKFLLLCSLSAASWLFADELSDILSNNKTAIFDYQFQSNDLEYDKLSKSWINPVTVQYSKTYTEQFKSGRIGTGSFTIGIDQPIFKSGGIYFAIKYAKAFHDANEADILLQKRQMIGNAVNLLFTMKKLKLQQQKLKYLIKNDAIDIKLKQESYDAGLLDSSFLDQALLQKNLDETSLLEMEVSLAQARQNFTLLSDKDPETLKLPTLRLISAKEYQGSNLELARERLRAKEANYNAKMTWTKYLPTVSLQGRYTDGDLNPLFQNPLLKEQYSTYGFTISMPIDINSLSDIEASKVAHLKAATEVIDRQDTVDEEYRLVNQNLNIIDKKIQLAQKDEKLYQNLYRVTKNLQKAGEKTTYDTAMMQNSLEIKRLDQKIYMIDKQIELLKLYTKVADAL
ncbi:MAG: TolC family protein [Campylobacterales bacterium]|nr:TolC family protein [Campylobacterales bacterium]